MHIGQEDGALAAGEEALLRKAVLLQDVKLRNIMTPRTAITYVNSAATFSQIIEQFRRSRFSRLPVYDSKTKTVTGIIHYKTLLFAVQERRKPGIAALQRPAIFVPESASILSIIRAMNTNMQNIAIVIDEHGGVAGLITMDDIIASQLILPGALRLEDCNELLHTDFHSDYYDTLGGFLLEKWGYLPHTNERLTCNRITFTVTHISNRRIDTVVADLSSVL